MFFVPLLFVSHFIPRIKHLYDYSHIYIHTIIIVTRFKVSCAPYEQLKRLKLAGLRSMGARKSKDEAKR